MPKPPETIEPDWPNPPGVRAFSTTRELGDAKSGKARAALDAMLPTSPAWLRQVHGIEVVDAGAIPSGTVPDADASFAREPGVVSAIMTADCMPVLLAARDGSVVAAAHAGWRGLCAGVIERTIDRMDVPGSELQAWLGPAIGPRAYEVGAEVRDAFLARDALAASAFVATRPGHWLLDLYAIARQRLADRGVAAVYGGAHCTATQAEMFFSYRRDKAVERMAAFIWRV
jgi:YfiH family protein